MDGIVHFGMPKTGSSSIQQTLFRLRNKANADFAFLSLDGDFSGNRVVQVLGNLDKRGQTGSESGETDSEKARVYGELEKQINAGAGKAVIFSSEIASRLPEEELAKLRGQFLAAGLSPRAVSYIRPPKSYMESIFQQRIKGGVGEFAMNPLFPKYRKAYEQFDSVFGAEHVEFWLFDPEHFLNGCVVQDFARHIGIRISPRQVRRANDSLPLPALKLLYTYRKFGAENGNNIDTIGNQRLIAALRELKGGKLRLHSSLIAPLLEKFQDEIQWAEQRVGASLHEDLTADDAIAVRSEEDMLSYSPDSLRWLAKKIAGHPLAKDVLGGEPETVAKGMHALYHTLLKGKPDMSRAQARRLRNQEGVGKSLLRQVGRLPSGILGKLQQLITSITFPRRKNSPENGASLPAFKPDSTNKNF